MTYTHQGRAGRYVAEIVANKMEPLGPERATWFAKVEHVRVYRANTPHQPEPLSAALPGEFYGVTEGEARGKATDAFREWVGQQR